MDITRKLRTIIAVGFFLTVVSSATAKYGGGRGTAEDPYQIWTPEQMNAIGTEPNDWDKHFQLMADIDLGLYADDQFHIIGTDPTHPFAGVFDGNRHVISNFHHAPKTFSADNVGLFGIVADPNAEIRNLTLVTPILEVAWGQHTGALVGHLREGTLTNCHAEEVSIRAFWYVGGLVGENGYVEPSPGTRRTSATLRNCSCTGRVSGSFTMVGGLAGKDSGGFFYDSSAAGTVSGPYDAGGLVGSAYDSTIISCYSRCAVEGDSGIGGLAGDIFACNIVGCYASGRVTGSAKVGGLIGSDLSAASVRSSFWDTQASGQHGSAGGTGITTSEMQDPNTFIAAGWDFLGEADGPSDIWVPAAEGDYPLLWWQLAQLPELPFPAGTGTADDPYRIATAAQLNSIGYNPRLMAAHFRLAGNIDLAGVPFYRIGSEEYPYSGVFDGADCAIANFAGGAGAPRNVGLFSVVLGDKAEVRNVRMLDPNIAVPTGYGVGSLIGLLGKGTIRNCRVEGGRVAGDQDVGGLIGRNGWWDLEDRYLRGRMVDCYAATNVKGRECVGGLAGLNGWLSRIAGSHADGNVEGVLDVGGLTGASISATITGCSAAGKVAGANYVGGLVGDTSYGIIEVSFSHARVEGDGPVGGLAGINRGTISNCYCAGDTTGDNEVGGLVGHNGVKVMWDEYPGTILHCYSAATVTGKEQAGGLIGRHEWGTISASFWDGQTCGQATSAGGTCKMTAEMQTAGTFLDAGWDFAGETNNGTEDIWWIDEGKDYPRLWWELPESGGEQTAKE